MYKSGAKIAYPIAKNFELHRLIVPMMMHVNFYHVFWNALTFFFVGFSVETFINDNKKYISLLLLGAVGGNLFSAVVDPYDLGVGASTSLFAVIGCLTIWFFINFYRMGPFRY